MTNKILVSIILSEMNKLNLPEELINQIIKEILSETNPEKIVLFGSHVRNNHIKSSDIDIALFGVSNEKIFLLKEKLNEELDTLRDIDLISFDSLKNEKLKINAKNDNFALAAA